MQPFEDFLPNVITPNKTNTKNSQQNQQNNPNPKPTNQPMNQPIKTSQKNPPEATCSLKKRILKLSKFIQLLPRLALATKQVQHKRTSWQEAKVTSQLGVPFL